MKLKFTEVPITFFVYISCVFLLRAFGQVADDDQIELPGGDGELYPTDPDTATTLPPVTVTVPTAATTTTTTTTTPIPTTIATAAPITTIGTNPPLVVGTCPSQCLSFVSDTNFRVDTLQVQLGSVNNTLSFRMQNLETNFYTTLSNRVTNIELALNAKLGDIETRLTKRINDLETFVNNRLLYMSTSTTTGASVTSFTTPTTPTPTVVVGTETSISELQKRIDNTKTEIMQVVDSQSAAIQSLQNFNKLWRKNFRVVNTTLATMKKNMNRISQQQG